MVTRCNFFERHDGGNYCKHPSSDKGDCNETTGSDGEILIECAHAHTLCECGELLSHKDSDTCLSCAIDSSYEKSRELK